MVDGETLARAPIERSSSTSRVVRCSSSGYGFVSTRIRNVSTPAATESTPALYVPEWLTSPRPTAREQLLGRPQHGHRVAGRHRLGVQRDVALDAEEALRPRQAEPESGDHLVDDEERAVAAAEVADPSR